MAEQNGTSRDTDIPQQFNNPPPDASPAIPGLNSDTRPAPQLGNQDGMGAAKDLSAEQYTPGDNPGKGIPRQHDVEEPNNPATPAGPAVTQP